MIVLLTIIFILCAVEIFVNDDFHVDLYVGAGDFWRRGPLIQCGPLFLLWTVNFYVDR